MAFHMTPTLARETQSTFYSRMNESEASERDTKVECNLTSHSYMLRSINNYKNSFIALSSLSLSPIVHSEI